MKIYVSGAMTGLPEQNFPAFYRAAKMLRDEGHEVFNPAEDVAQGKTYRDYLAADLAWICEHADAVAMIPGWEHSKGARAEHATAVALGLMIVYLS